MFANVANMHNKENEINHSTLNDLIMSRNPVFKEGYFSEDVRYWKGHERMLNVVNLRSFLKVQRDAEHHF